MTAKFRSKNIVEVALTLAALFALGLPAHAQEKAPAPPPAARPATATAAPATTEPTPADYVIGPEDVLSIIYWRDKEMTGDVSVRPDGKISLPLLNDVPAAGLTPTQLRANLIEASKRFFEDPDITVVVSKMNSRRVFITGEVEKPGPYPLTGPTTVLHLISMAGGLREYADAKKIVILRNENGKPITYPFNYKDVVAGKNLRQNIELKLGDTVLVP